MVLVLEIVLALCIFCGAAFGQSGRQCVIELRADNTRDLSKLDSSELFDIGSYVDACTSAMPLTRQNVRLILDVQGKVFLEYMKRMNAWAAEDEAANDKTFKMLVSCAEGK